ncbi:Rab3 GTPase-activating protein regulatory subunit, partial [Diplonema papillatum]
VSGGQQPSMAAYNMVTETASAADLAKGAAKKVTTAALSLVSSWWGGHGEAASKAPQLPAAARVHPSHVFNDAGRTVQRVTIDSVGRYLSTSDTLGRVTIMDTAMFVTVKMLKGYRDASVVWLNGKSPERAVGTFFVYLPRRGLVEAWKVSKPARLAAFKIGLNCRLLTPCPTKPCACLVLHPDGRLSTLCLEHEEDRKKGETGAGAMTQSAQLKLWREKAATPGVDEETLLTVLEGVRPAVDLLECVVTLSDSLGLQVWRCVTTAAMGQLEKQGVNLEHALQESQKTTASNDTLSASMDGCDDIDACLRRSPVSEADRLMSPDSPALSEADVYRYLIHRLSALNACVMLVARPSAKRRKAELVAIQQAWTQAMQSIVFDEPAVPPLGSLFSLGPRGDDEQADEEALSRRDLSPSKFLAHFDLIKQAIVLHAATPDLADFICYPLVCSFHRVLSLENTYRWEGIGPGTAKA